MDYELDSVWLIFFNEKYRGIRSQSFQSSALKQSLFRPTFCPLPEISRILNISSAELIGFWRTFFRLSAFYEFIRSGAAAPHPSCKEEHIQGNYAH